MQCLQGRIDSFKKPKRVKRYPSKSSSSTASVKWPHPLRFKANANTLAEAGFYFSPSWDDRDCVTCFLCGKELSDWDASDDPFEIHYTKCQSSCAWAVVRCGLTDDLDEGNRFVFRNKARLPCSKGMERARLETFGQDWWPHDEDPGHGATSVKMAQAGFVYTPQAAGDDTVTCLYCNLSLSGWERQDDPIQEHRSRGSKSGAACAFLASSTERLAKSRRKTKATRGKSAKASTPVSRRSPSSGQPDPPEREGAAALVTSTDTNGPELDSVIQPPADDPVPVPSDEPVPPPDPPNHPDPDPDPVKSPSSSEEPATGSHLMTHRERAMSLEEWIRHEIDLNYDRLLTDGRKQIDMFKTKAAELRRRIDEL